MKVIIAGSRTITDYNIVEMAILTSGFDITEVVSGGARGVDTLGERYANHKNIPIKRFLADWDNLNPDGDPVFVKVNSYGKKINAVAGHNRNKKMAKYADACILVWDGKSKGTLNMKELATKYNLKLYVMNVKE